MPCGNVKLPASPEDRPGPAPPLWDGGGAGDMNEPPSELPAAPDMYDGIGACIGPRLWEGGKVENGLSR